MVDGCGQPYYAKGCCDAHYQATRNDRPGKACSTPGCAGKFYALGLCGLCYQRDFQKRPEQLARKRRNNAKYRVQPKGQLKEFRNRLRKKGFTVELYETRLAEQQNRCALCTATFEQYKIQCDHDHVTGKARGLLCNPCNVSLGMYETHQSGNGLTLDVYDRYIARFR